MRRRCAHVVASPIQSTGPPRNAKFTTTDFPVTHLCPAVPSRAGTVTYMTEQQLFETGIRWLLRCLVRSFPTGIPYIDESPNVTSTKHGKFEDNFCYIPLRLFVDDWDDMYRGIAAKMKPLLQELVHGRIFWGNLTEDQIHNVFLSVSQLNLPQLVFLRFAQPLVKRADIMQLMKRIDELISESLTLFATNNHVTIAALKELRLEFLAASPTAATPAFSPIQECVEITNTPTSPTKIAITRSTIPVMSEVERKNLFRERMTTIFQFREKGRKNRVLASQAIIHRSSPTHKAQVQTILPPIQALDAFCDSPWTQEERIAMGRSLVSILGAICCLNDRTLRRKVTWWLVTSPKAEAPKHVARMRCQKDVGQKRDDVRGLFVQVPSLFATTRRPSGEMVYALHAERPLFGDTSWKILSIDFDGDIRLLQPVNYFAVLEELKKTIN